MRGAQGSPAVISAQDAAAPVSVGAAGGPSAICAVEHEAPSGEQPRPSCETVAALC